MPFGIGTAVFIIIVAAIFLWIDGSNDWSLIKGVWDALMIGR